MKTFFASLLLVGLVFVSGCASHPRRWESKIVNLPAPPNRSVLDEINRLGEEGWRVQCEVPPDPGMPAPPSGGGAYLFVRPKP